MAPATIAARLRIHRRHAVVRRSRSFGSFRPQTFRRLGGFAGVGRFDRLPHALPVERRSRHLAVLKIDHDLAEWQGFGEDDLSTRRTGIR